MAEVLSQCFADIPVQPQNWIWYGWLPLNEAVLAAGDPGIGKGVCEAELASLVSNGLDMPDGTDGLGGAADVIIVALEDHLNRAVAPRLHAAGADLNRVHSMSRVRGEKFTVQDHSELLQKELRRLRKAGHPVRLVVIDPADAATVKQLTSAKVARQGFWDPLAQVAEDEDCCVLVLHHTTKSGSIGGSRNLVNAARLVLRFSRTELDPAIREIRTEVTNVGPEMRPMLYTLAGKDAFQYVEWIDADIPDIGRIGDVSKAILAHVILKGSITIGKAMEAGKCSDGQARLTLHRLVKEGLITRLRRGVYGSVDKAA